MNIIFEREKIADRNRNTDINSLHPKPTVVRKHFEQKDTNDVNKILGDTGGSQFNSD